MGIEGLEGVEREAKMDRGRPPFFRMMLPTPPPAPAEESSLDPVDTVGSVGRNMLKLFRRRISAMIEASMSNISLLCSGTDLMFQAFPASKALSTNAASVMAGPIRAGWHRAHIEDRANYPKRGRRCFFDNIWLFLFSGNGTAPQSVVMEVAVDGLRRIDNYGQVGGGGRPDRGIFSQ